MVGNGFFHGLTDGNGWLEADSVTDLRIVVNGLCHGLTDGNG